MVYTLHFFSSKCSLFHNSNLFGSCIIDILYTECAKIKKNNSGAKRLIKIQPDATVCRYLLIKSLYMFQVSQHPSSGVLRTVTAASGTGHNTGTATSLQRGLIWTPTLHAIASGWIFINIELRCTEP